MLLGEIVAFLKEKEVLEQVLEWRGSWEKHSNFFDTQEILHIKPLMILVLLS